MSKGAPKADISLLMLGDFVPLGGYKEALARHRSAVFGFLNQEIAASDVSFLNVEAPLCRDGQAIVKSGPALKVSPEVAQTIAEAGFTVAGLANNHVMDFGIEGLASTRSALEGAGVVPLGAGLTLAEAWAPYVYIKDGRSLALLAVAEREFNVSGEAGAAIADEIDLTQALLKLIRNHDVVIVTLHGGNEYYSYPRPGLRRLCRYLIALGAHAVICHHTHVRGAYETHLGRPIVYSLGNAIFDHPSPPKGWAEGFAAKLNISFDEQGRPRVDLNMVPFVQSAADGGIRSLTADEVDLLESWRLRMRAVMESEEAFIAEWKSFCRRREHAALAGLLAPVRAPGLGRAIKAIRKLGGFRSPARLNLVRCPSHREMLTSILESS